MRRRVLLCLALISVSACNGDKIGQPIASPASPTKAISDGNHCVGSAPSCVNGNPDFFFLPPMVPDPTGTTNWTAGAFNPSLAPTVDICELLAISESAATGEACVASRTTSYAAALRATDEHYAYNWKVPSSSTIFYRIVVRVGTKVLGFAEVETGSTAQIKNVATQQYIPLVDGRTLPIKFRIERYALCTVAGVGPCASASADITTTSLTVFTGTPTSDPNGISDVKGVFIPIQLSGDNTPVTATLTTCGDLGPVIHRQTIGDCLRVSLDPARTLSNPATVFICSVGLQTRDLPAVDPEAIRMYRSDAQGVVVLQPAHACQPQSPGGVASAGPSLHDVFASLAHGRFTLAAKAAVALVSPKPLYAARFIDLGGGGFTDGFSDFQFALPPSVLIYGPSLFTPSTAEPVNEQTLAAAAAMSVTVWDATTWASKTSADFARFNAIVFADPHCVTSTTHLATANDTKDRWSPSVNGPVVIIGTDPVFHQNRAQSPVLMTNAIKFAASNPSATGLYVSLSCYYAGNAAATPVDFLSGIGSFSVVGQSGLSQTVSIASPLSAPLSAVMAGLTDAGLSNWDISVHEAFPALADYPSTFSLLASVYKPSTESNLAYIIARP